MRKHNFNKILALLLVLVMVVPCLPVVATAEEVTYTYETRTVTAEEKAAWLAKGGDGVYEIGSVHDLACFMAVGMETENTTENRFANSAGTSLTIKLTADIYWNYGEIVDGKFIPDAEKQGNVIYTWSAFANKKPSIPNQHQAFRGIFDGDGHTIHGLYAEGGSANNQCFIAYTGTGAQIKNVTFAECYSKTTGWYNAIVVSQPRNSLTISNVNVSGCYLKGGRNTGALIGYMNPAVNTAVVTIDNCTVSGTIDCGTSAYAVGGFIGANRTTPVSISNSVCCAHIICATSGGAGFIGAATADVSFDNCSFLGTFNGTDWARERLPAYAFLVRNNDNYAKDTFMTAADGTANVTLKDCYFTKTEPDGETVGRPSHVALRVNEKTPWYKIFVSYTGGTEGSYDCTASEFDAATSNAAINDLFSAAPEKAGGIMEIAGVQVSKIGSDGKFDARFVATLDLGDYKLDDIDSIGFEVIGVDGNVYSAPVSKDTSFVYEYILQEYGTSAVTAKALNADYLAVLVIDDIDSGLLTADTADDAKKVIIRVWCEIDGVRMYNTRTAYTFNAGVYTTGTSQDLG